MLAAPAAEGTAVEARIACIGLSDGEAHARLGAACLVHVDVPHRPDKAASTLIFRQHDVVLLLSVRLQFTVIVRHRGAVSESALRPIDRRRHSNTSYQLIHRIFDAHRAGTFPGPCGWA